MKPDTTFNIVKYWQIFADTLKSAAALHCKYWYSQYNKRILQGNVATCLRRD